MSISDYLPTTANAYRVTRGIWTLFNGQAIPTLVLTGTLPAVTFKCAVTVTSGTGSHTDCIGSVVVGSESLSFTYSGQKRTTTNSLSALPVCTTANLDCTVKITCIDSGGADILQETLTSIIVGVEGHTESFQDGTGAWTKTNSRMFSTTSLAENDIIRYSGKDYVVKRIDDRAKLNVHEFTTAYCQ